MRGPHLAAHFGAQFAVYGGFGMSAGFSWRGAGEARFAQIEQVVRASAGGAAHSSAVPQGMTACAAVVVGNTVSEAASWVYMEWCYRRAERTYPVTQSVPVQRLVWQLWLS